MVKLIVKGIVLYVTFFVVILFIFGADSVMNKGLNHFLGGMSLCAALVFTCCNILSKEDFEKLTFHKYLKDE